MGEVLGFGKFACVEIKSLGEIFQEAICYKKLLRFWVCACGKEIERALEGSSACGGFMRPQVSPWDFGGYRSP